MKIRDVKDKSCDNERKDGINLKDKEKCDGADIPDMTYRRRVTYPGFYLVQNLCMISI